MKSDNTGTDTSKAEVLNVSPHGFWLMIGGNEFFLSFVDFPWFRKATLEQLFTVELSHHEHLYWPELDIDLDIERVRCPEKFPLIARNI